MRRRGYFGSWYKIRELKEENARLAAEIAELKAEIAELRKERERK